MQIINNRRFFCTRVMLKRQENSVQTGKTEEVDNFIPIVQKWDQKSAIWNHFVIVALYSLSIIVLFNEVAFFCELLLYMPSV